MIKDNPFFAACKKLQDIFDKVDNNAKTLQVGRPKKYSELQIIQCFLYKITNKIYCLRKLEWLLKNDVLSAKIIGLSDIPDHTTFCIRLKEV